MKNNIELADTIWRLRPLLPYDDIIKTLVKLRKLAKTLRKRDPGGGGLYEDNTEKFYAKAYKLAQYIGVSFVSGWAHNASTDTLEHRFWLRIDQVMERLL